MQELIDIFAGFRPASTFVSIKEYENSQGEVSNFGIAFHINYLNALKKSNEIVKAHISFRPIEKIAQEKILESYAKRIAAYEEPLEERDGPYIYFKDWQDKYIKGIKAHKETNELYMFGLMVSKTVVKPVEYKVVNSAALTIERARLESLTPVSRFRQFKLLPKSYKEIRIENMIIE